MKHKLMIYIPLVLFICATIVLGVAVFRQKSNNRIELPAVLLRPTPTVIEVVPTSLPTTIVTPTPVDLSVQIKSDLGSVLGDIGKVRVEDTRFKPPTFILDMGID